MNYTENYHLPQWVKSDRIMMEDFNQMCADIEAGLSKTAQAAEEFGQTGDARDNLLTRQLIRLAYNQYLAARSMTPFPEQVGVFYQNAVRDMTSAEGSPWDGARFTGSGTGSFTAENFFQQCGKSISNLVMVKNDLANSKPLEMEISVPVTTRVAKFNLSGSINDNTPYASALFLVTLKNLDTGVIEQSFQLDLGNGSVSVIWVNRPQPATLYFLSGCRYLLRIEPVGNPVFNSNLAIGYGVDLEVQSVGGSSRSVNISHTMREQEGSSMGLLFLQCKAGGATGQMTVKWDGKTVTPTLVRTIQNSQGLDLREMIFVRHEPIPAETSFSVDFSSGANGSFWIQEWGAILL